MVLTWTTFRLLPDVFDFSNVSSLVLCERYLWVFRKQLFDMVLMLWISFLLPGVEGLVCCEHFGTSKLQVSNCSV